MSECLCDDCKNACNYRPGWFKPNEIDAAAKSLGMTTEEFFKTKLAVDWWESDEEIFVIAPAIQGEETGEEYPSDPRGKCIFFKDGLCEIHGAKPFECKEYNHTEDYDDVAKRHREVVESWKDYQTMVRKLLKRKPMAKEFYGGGIFGGMFG